VRREEYELRELPFCESGRRIDGHHEEGVVHLRWSLY
jgi:hypothetical protein